MNCVHIMKKNIYTLAIKFAPNEVNKNSTQLINLLTYKYKK